MHVTGTYIYACGPKHACNMNIIILMCSACQDNMHVTVRVACAAHAHVAKVTGKTNASDMHVK